MVKTDREDVDASNIATTYSIEKQGIITQDNNPMSNRYVVVQRLPFLPLLPHFPILALSEFSIIIEMAH
jgi:hypothetical protein